MDRNTVTGLILILIVMVAWAYFTMPTNEEIMQRQAEQARQDSIAAAQADSQMATTRNNTGTAQQDTQTTQPPRPAVRQEEKDTGPEQMGMFTEASGSDTSYVTIETPRYRTRFTNVGAGPAKFQLKRYNSWNQQPVQMIADTTQSAYSLGFLTTENYNVETDQLIFEQLTPGDTITIPEGESRELQYALDLPDGRRITYTYTFHANSYEINLDIRYSGLQDVIVGGRVDFGWNPALKFTEKSRQSESTHTSAYSFLGGELEQLNLTESGHEENNYNGTIDWVSTRTKFFTQVIKPQTPTEGALLVGEVTGAPDNPATTHTYRSYIKSQISAEGNTRFDLYIGPLLYSELKHYDEHTYDMVNVGYFWLSWFSDPLVRYIIIPYLNFTGDFMNYGLAIIFFAILIKLVLYPLTKKSFKSMAAMRELQPEMKKIQEKYKDNPQKQQEATLKLYKKANVNPLGGCLPNLLQLPILITLWRFFQNSILLRQESFLWASDLSAPDYILSLPFNIPFLGDQLAGFVLLMTGAMVVQSRLTGGMSGGGAGGGMNMKAMQYFLPIILLFVFNNFAAGLSLYYLIYNVMSIGQQLLINKELDKENGNSD